MLTNTGPVAKLYLSIIDDVIDSIRELFVDEGLEDRVLDDLKHLWESKMMQSKAMEDLRKNNINSSNFVLQLPASYSHADRELAASVVIPASQNLRTFPVKSSSETLATFSLPAGLSYPVQIPAGVTLQTASGQLYKVNIPVVVTQAPAGQQALSKQHQKVPEWRKVPLPAAVPPGNAQEVAPAPAPVPPSAPQTTAPVPPSAPQTNTSSASSQEPAAEPPRSPQPQLPPEEDEASPQPLNLSTSAASSSCSQLSDFQNSAEETLTQTAHLKSRDIDDILKEVIEEEREKAARARSLAPEKTLNQADADLGLDLDFSELSDIVQLDGAVDNSDLEEDEGAPLEENDFLGMINAEAIRALQEGDGSSDGNSLSSSSDSEGADELAHVEEEDPLNSGDDVIEQDIPDLFDTENIIVCQYDKIHRSKNRWKFHLKDGVMCYGGRDYVFSKAVGEAEW